MKYLVIVVLVFAYSVCFSQMPKDPYVMNQFNKLVKEQQTWKNNADYYQKQMMTGKNPTAAKKYRQCMDSANVYFNKLSDLQGNYSYLKKQRK